MNNNSAQECNLNQSIFGQSISHTPMTFIGVPILMFVPVLFNTTPFLIAQDWRTSSNGPNCNINKEP